jgi:hypothetical protein
MARKFETEYRAARTDEVLRSENKFRLSVDLRFDALERGLADLGSDASVLVARVVRAIETEISPRAAEIAALLADYRAGVPAALVAEEADGRQFLTPARRTAILTDLRGGVAGDYDTLAKIVLLVAGKATPADITAAINALKGSAPAAYDTLQEIAAWMANDESAEAAMISAIAAKQDKLGFQPADKAGDTFAGTVTVRSSEGLGSVSMNSGDGSAPGYLSFFKPDGSRAGYIGFKAGMYLLFAVEGGYSGYQFTTTPTVNGAAVWHGGDSALLTATDGYLKLPNGLILQWGTKSGGEQWVTFPATFPATCIAVVATMGAGHAATTLLSISVGNKSAAGFSAYPRYTSSGAIGSESSAFHYVAIGW